MPDVPDNIMLYNWEDLGYFASLYFFSTPDNCCPIGHFCITSRNQIFSYIFNQVGSLNKLLTKMIDINCAANANS